MKIVFLATPQFAVPILQALVRANHQVVLVVSQPDREKDKKGNLIKTAVAKAAQQLNLPCAQIEKISSEQGVALLKSVKPDIMVTAAYGQMLKAEVLEIAKLGIFNVHASLLPKYRGSSPIQTAILSGDSVTGITIMKTQLSMDTGDIYATSEVEIAPTDTLSTVTEKLMQVGAQLIVQTLPKLESGEIVPIVQDESQATYCKKVSKADGNLNFASFTATEAVNRIRAFNPWPCVYTFYNDKNIKIYSAEVIDNCVDGECGQIVICNKKQLAVRCKNNTVINILSMQAPGKRITQTEEFLRGYKIAEGEFFKSEITTI